MANIPEAFRGGSRSNSNRSSPPFCLGLPALKASPLKRRLRPCLIPDNIKEKSDRPEKLGASLPTWRLRLMAKMRNNSVVGSE